MTTTHEECDALAKEAGFEDAAEFLGYCALHSTTELALFNGVQIGALQVMAGHADVGRENMKFRETFRSVDLSDLVAVAHARMDQTNMAGSGI